jgi:transketolase
MDYEPIAAKVTTFGWEVSEIDGHDADAIGAALGRVALDDARPSFIVARTTKGKGVSFMEDQQYWHGSVPIAAEQLAIASRELGIGSAS